MWQLTCYLWLTNVFPRKPTQLTHWAKSICRHRLPLPFTRANNRSNWGHDIIISDWHVPSSPKKATCVRPPSLDRHPFSILATGLWSPSPLDCQFRFPVASRGGWMTSPTLGSVTFSIRGLSVYAFLSWVMCDNNPTTKSTSDRHSAIDVIFCSRRKWNGIKYAAQKYQI